MLCNFLFPCISMFLLGKHLSFITHHVIDRLSFNKAFCHNFIDILSIKIFKFLMYYYAFSLLKLLTPFHFVFTFFPNIMLYQFVLLPCFILFLPFNFLFCLTSFTSFAIGNTSFFLHFWNYLAITSVMSLYSYSLHNTSLSFGLLSGTTF